MGVFLLVSRFPLLFFCFGKASSMKGLWKGEHDMFWSGLIARILVGLGMEFSTDDITLVLMYI